MVLRRERQVDICDPETSLVYIVSSRAARAIVETLSEKKKSHVFSAASVAPGLAMMLWPSQARTPLLAAI